MCHAVTKRFMQCIEFLKEKNRIKSVRQFAISIDIHPQNLSDIANSKRDVTIDIIYKTASLYQINTNYIFQGVEPMFLDQEENVTQKETSIVADKNNIVYIPVSAYAGYSEQFFDEIYLNDLSSFSLPDYRYNSGEYRCFDIAGDSMEPSLHAGDKVVCSKIEKHNFFSSIRNNHVYVVVLEGGIVVKRVVNKIHQNQTLSLISDNNFYDPYDVSIENVREVWHVELKISHYLPSPKNFRYTFHDEMEGMKQTITEQSKSIATLNMTIEKLLRHSRSMTI